MGSPSFPEVARRLVGQPRPKPGEKFWNSEGLISPPDPSTVETPEERYAREHAIPEGVNPYEHRSMMQRSQRSRNRIMDQYRREYEIALRGGTPDAELGSGMTSVQFE